MICLDKLQHTLNKYAHKPNFKELRTLRAELEQKLEPLLHKEIINESSGQIASISKTTLKKIGSNQALQKSIDNGFSKEEHFLAGKNIDSLYEKSFLQQTTGDLKNNDKAIKIHRFLANATLNDKPAQAKILVKESMDKDTKRIYTLELEELKPTSLDPTTPRVELVENTSKSKDKSGATFAPDEVSANPTTNSLTWNQNGNVLQAVLELGESKILLQKDGFGNIYASSSRATQPKSYDEAQQIALINASEQARLEQKIANHIQAQSSTQNPLNPSLRGGEASDAIRPESQSGGLRDEIARNDKELGNPLAEFGTNYPQFYHKGAQAVEHLLKTRSGQVAGAFEKEGLGDIDLVWGDEKKGFHPLELAKNS